MTTLALVSFAAQTASMSPWSAVYACSNAGATLVWSHVPAVLNAGLMPASDMTLSAPSWNCLALPSVGSPPT